MKDDPFDTPFFNEQEEQMKDRARENSTIRRWLGFGFAAWVVLMIIQLVFYGMALGIIVAIAWFVLHFLGIL